MQPKEIISQFLQVEANSITASTLINRQALKSSIFVHRMYGKLADAGFIVNDYSSIDTFGELTNMLDGKSQNPKVEITNTNSAVKQFTTKHQTRNNSSIGIDIEQVSFLPKTNDFRTDRFYVDNFSEKEIAYCILQPNVYSSFSGLFAAKEAIVKADNKFKKIPFKLIEISHDSFGKPEFGEMNISISHTAEMAVAVASTKIENITLNTENNVVKTNNYVLLLIMLNIIMLGFLVFFMLFHTCK